jgi:peptidase M1-like protein
LIPRRAWVAAALLLQGSAVAWGAGTPPPPPAAFPSPPAPRKVTYRIDARLDPRHRTVTATEIVTYRNDSPDALPEIPFHLYPNAFASDGTLFARELLQEENPPPALAGARRTGGWGWIRVTSVGVEGGADLAASTSMDETVMRVHLPEPLAPGAALSLRIAWETKLPRVIARMGAWGDHFDVMQWFPKPGVYRDGSWVAPSFHARAEFFADFADFDVSLTVPAGFRVEAGGVPGPERNNPDGTRTLAYRAENVHDFAWVADPNARIARENYRGIDIVFFHQPQHEALVPRILAMARDCLRLYGEWYLPYPYPRIVIVDLPMGLGGGMEYPMLVTTFMAWFLPDWYIAPESVTAHELGHQIWYGVVATDEFDEAWLDEGINTYSTLRLLEATALKPQPGATLPSLFRFALLRALGDGIPLDLGFHRFNLNDLVGFRRTPFQETASTLLGYPVTPFSAALPGLTPGYLAGRREAFFRHGTEDPLERSSWDFHPGGYHDTVYAKTALVLKTMEGILGPEMMARILKEYASRWRFKHPTAGDFLAVAEEMGGAKVKPVEEQLVYGAATVDFAVESVRSERTWSPSGVLPQERVGEPLRKSRGGDAPGGEYLSEVVVRRLGDAVLPVQILVTFEDGSTTRETWDASSRWRRYSYLRRSRIASAVIDPDRVYMVDLDFNNNSYTTRHQGRAVRKLTAIWLFWLQNYLHLISTFS